MFHSLIQTGVMVHVRMCILIWVVEGCTMIPLVEKKKRIHMDHSDLHNSPLEGIGPIGSPLRDQ